MIFDPALPPLIVEDEPKAMRFNWRMVLLFQFSATISGALVWLTWYWVTMYAAWWFVN